MRHIRSLVLTAKNFVGMALWACAMLCLVSCTKGGSLVDKLVGLNGNLLHNGGIGNAALVFSPTPLNLGNVGVGHAAATGTIVVTNNALVDIQLGQTVSPASAALSISSNTCSAGTKLKVGQTCSMIVSYKPTASENLNDAVAVQFTAAQDTTTVFSNSDKIVAVAIAPLNFPGLLPIAASDVSTTKVTVRWAALAASSFVIYDVSSGTPVQVGSALGTDTSYTVSGLTHSTTYSFRANALDVLNDPDTNTINQSATTDDLGAFSAIAPLAASEGATSTTAALNSLCTDSKGHAPQMMLIASQSDSDLQCSMLTGPYEVTCTPNHKAGLGSWTGTVVVNCLLDDYPAPYAQNLVVNVAKVFRNPVLAPISGQSVVGGVAITPVQANGSSPDGDTINYSCQYDSQVDGAVSASAASCASLLNQNGSNATFTSGGLFNWTPTLTNGGRSYEFKIIATGATSGLTASQIFVINVNYPPPSSAQSTVTVSSNTVASGSPVTVTFHAKDSAGNVIPVGGANVAFGFTGGTSTGTFSSVVDNHDGTYTASFIGASAGTATHITSTVQGSTVTTGQPSVTVTPGPISPTQSAVVVGASTLISGNSTSLTLTAKDAFGNLLGAGGAAVAFTRSGGTSTGSISATTDNGNGTYSATFTGVASGTPTSIGATINGIAITTTTPSIQVTPGAVSLATSAISLTGSPTTLGAGSGVQVKLTAHDAAGNNIASGGLTIAFTFGGGTSTGSFGTVNDNADGTYTAVLTGVTAGSTSQIGATIGGANVTSALPSLQIVPGPASPLYSTVAVGTATIASGSTTLLTLQAIDAYHNTIGVGGATVAFSASGGTSTGSISATTDNNNGTYTAVFSAVNSGTATTIGAKIATVSVSTTLPTITVSPGQIAASSSVVSVSSNSVVSGSSITVTLAAKDAAGNSLTSGGATVAFTRSGGTSTGNFSSTTDHGNGTYTATFTGVIAGTGTNLSATISGIAVGTSAPAITVTPGAIAPASSILTVSSATVGSGSNVTATLTAKDAAGNSVPTGGATVVFSSSGGTSTGSFSATVDNGNGAYISQFTGIIAGTPTTISATIGGVSLATTLPTITVTPGPASTASSVISVSASSIMSGTSANLTVQLKDAAGNNLTAGGASLVFSNSGGSSTGTIATAADQSNGTYTSTFTGVLAGTATSIGASINGTPISSTKPSIIVTAGAISVANSLITVSAASVASGSSLVVTLQARDSAGNSLSVGGNTVVFARTGGTSTGTFGTVLDNGNGTYSSSFTGNLAGTATSISATVAGVNVTTTLPSVTVTPGPISPVTSLVTVGSASLVSGASETLTLQAKDAAGNLVLVGGSSILFTRSGGTSTGTIGATNDGGNGVYTANFLGVLAGTATSLSASIGGTAISTAAPTITVSPGVPSSATSLLSVSGATVASGSTVTLTVQTKDAAGNIDVAGGATITFAASGGSSTGSFSTVTDNGDGTYQATFKGVLAGSATTIKASLNGTLLTTGNVSEQVLPGAISMANSLVSVASPTLASGTSETITLQARDAAGNSLSSGGASVVFSSSGGSSTGTFSAVTDNGNGSYVSSFTGVLAGTALSVQSTVNGTAVTTTMPTITVIPGTISAAASVITVASPTVQSGTVDALTLRARDAAGNTISSGGATVVFTASGGSSTGTVGSTTDNSNGTYSANFTGNLAGTATSISATIGGTAVTTTLPNVQVTPGAPSAATSLITSTLSTLPSGNSTTVTVQAKDTAGNNLIVGGATVVFSTIGGTSTGTLTATIDHGNGTYSTTFTGVLAGSATSLAATLNGASITTTDPTIVVTPGVLSLAQSQITLASATVASGSSVLATLQARDNAGNNITSGGSAVAFTHAGGSSTGTFGVVTDNGNGTYSASFAGVLAGSATTIGATVTGSAITSTLPTLTVVPGAISVSTSLVSVTATSVNSGAAITIKLTAKDAAGNSLVSGGSAVVFNASGGTSTGSIGTTTDLSNGSYTATFTGVLAGSPTTIAAQIGGTAVTTTLPTITVNPGAANSAQSSIAVSSASVDSGSNVTVTLTAKDAAGNALNSGGATVAFTTSGGSSTGALSSTTDGGNGTYTATFTGILAGAATTISGTVGGSAVSTALPTVTVVPGPISPANFAMTVASPTVASGSSVNVNLTARDAAGNAVTSGGATIVVSRSGGSSTGTFGTVIDSNNGTYRVPFSGVIAGTATTINATVNNIGVATTLPTITVVPGAISTTGSTIAVSSATAQSATHVTLTLTAKDAAGNAITTGGQTVAFAASGGTSTGTIAATTDNGNGTYSAVFTGVLAGTATNIGATIAGAAVASASPTIQVTPGSPFAGTSILTVGATTVSSGNSTQVTLTAKDAAGNSLVVGGAAVVFSSSGGTATGSLTSAIDNGNGTYSSTFTGVLTGSATSILATLNGASLTTTSPTIAVTPGALSLAQSQITLASATVASGSNVLVTLQAKDTAGNSILTGGSTVTFTRSGGSSTVSFGAVTDNGNGTYSASLTGVVAGSATSIGGTVGGAAITSTLPVLTVIPGSISAATSLVSVSAATVKSGAGLVLTLTAKDAAGNALTSGGSSVAFAVSGGTSTGSIGSTADHSNGVYTATFTGVTAGTASTISATIGGTAVSTTLPTVVVTPGDPSSSTSVLTVASSSVNSGAVDTLTLTAKDAAGNTLSAGGATIVFSSSGGTSTGAIGAATDNGNGTYTASFTGVLVGTATTISATVNGSTLSTTLPLVTVTPGAVSPVNALITTASSNVTSGGTVVVTVQARDAAGNNVASGGATVALSRSGGTSTGTFSAVSDNSNGTYTASFTGVTSGTATTLHATFNGTTVTTTAPTLTVVPGAIAPAASTITVGSATVVSGATVTLSLQAKDAAGNLITSGGATVAFNAGGGGSTGSIAVTSDNGNGTYSAIFTGVLAGTATSIGATINSAAVSTTLPTVQVTPGAPSASTSLVTVAASTVSSGNSVGVTFNAKDAAGNNLVAGGATVTFSSSGGTATGTLSSAIDNGNGTYSANFTGVLAGSATSLSATLNGAPVTTTKPAISVTPGALSVSQSLITLTSATVASGASMVATLQAKDSAGNNILTGGSTVAFSRSGGSSTGTFGMVSDNGNGTYSVNFTGAVAGSATTIGATVSGVAITSTLPTLTVVPGAISEATSLVTLSSSTVNSGSVVTLTLTAKDAAGNLLTSGGSAISFGNSGGTSTGAIGSTNDHSNGTYSAVFTGALAGTPTTISASVGGLAVTTTLPTLTVNPGSASSTKSVLTASLSSVQSGATATLTLTAKDAAGNTLLSGGSTVIFSSSGGTSSGSIGATTDNANGTYSATFTGIAAGTATTLSATVNGSVISTTLPQITVTPGSIAPANFLVTAASSTVVSGSQVIVTVRARDAAGNGVSTAGATVALARSGGTSTGTFGAVTDNNDGTYSAAFSGVTAGTATSILATVNSTSVTTTAPTITVTPGAISPTGSVITVASSSVVSGSTVALVLQAKDAAGNTVTAGGATVAFTASGGASTGTIGATTDNGNGTYSAIFTGVLAGTPTTISGTVGGAAVTTTLPTVQVTPGSASPSTSAISVTSSTVPSGSSTTLTVQAKDAAGNNLIAGGSAVVFSVSGGTSTGSLTSTIDNGNGTYTASFTGQVAGTAVSVNATLNGTAISTAKPALTVTPGSLSLSQSVVTLAASTVASGSSVVATLTAKDAAGNSLVAGGSTVAFTRTGGTSTGNFAATTDVGNGTYTASFTGVTAGTATSIGATVGSSAVTSIAPQLTVLPGVISVATSTVNASVSTVKSGSALTLSLTAKDAAGNLLTSGGSSIAFGNGGGTSTGSVGSTVDHSNGTYTASFTGSVAGSATTVTSTIGGVTVTTTMPTITVTPGDPSAATSVITVSSSSVSSGQSITLNLQAKDAVGNSLTAGGATVSFSYSGGSSTGTIGTVVDNGNGTYSAPFTGVLAGTATSISAVLGGSSVATTLPTVQVLPGAISVSQSAITVSSATVGSGSSITLKLTAKDAAGNALTTGGSAVAFTNSGGTSTGSIGSTTDAANGTYTAAFTGVVAGTVTSISATVGGVSVTSTSPTVRVTPGAISVNQSVLTASNTTVSSGSALTLTLTAKDSAGNTLTTGGSTVVFGYSGGSSTGAVGSTTDNANGTYTATFTGVLAGAATNVTATIGGVSVTTAAPHITVTPGGPSAATSLLFVTNANILSGGTSTLSLQSKDAAGNTITTGGAAIVFNASGGGSTGSITASTDNGDGTYSATFTGILAGTATTIGATVGGVAVSTTGPTVRVTPGAVSIAQSYVSVQGAPSFIKSAYTATVIMTARDTAGNTLTSGGLAVTFSYSGGTSTGVFSSVIDNGNGTYTATLTGQAAGTSSAVGGLISGTALTSTKPNLIVVPGDVSLSNSTVAVSSAAVNSGGTSNITVATKDSYGNSINSGITVLVANSGGTSTGTFSSVVDNGNGTQSATFTGQATGSATTIGATLNGAAITSALPSITVNPGAINGATSTLAVSSTSVLSGNSVTITLTGRDANGNLEVAGGATVVFSSSGGTSTGTIGSFTDNANGTYTATFLGQAAGTATTIRATINGTSISTTLPTVTVSPGAISVSRSLITVSSASVASGATVNLTLTSKDNYGNAIPTGGATVLFARSGGTSTGSFGVVNDNGDGTYTTTFTAASSGTATTITGTINGSAVTSTLPTITVNPGAINLAQSVLTVSTTTIAAGSTTSVSLQAKDAAGNNLTTGGRVVAFGRNGGSSSGTFSSTVDNATGVYTATFTGTTSGTPTSITASIDGSALTSTLPQVTVNVGPASLSQSVVTVSASSVASGATSVLTLSLKDAYGNAQITGGATTTFTLSGGTSIGSLTSVIDNSNGTYSATFTGNVAGTTLSVSATVGGSALTSTPASLIVVPGALSLSRSLATVSSTSVISGSSINLILTAKDANGNLLTTGGSTVVFNYSGGTSTGSIGSTSDSGNGTYSATFTGIASGTATTIGVSVGGNVLTSTLPTVMVTAGAINLARSTVSVSSASIASGATSTVTLQAKDAAGNNLTVGGSSVAFARTGGGSSGTFSAVTDNANGTYTSTFTGTISGTATTLAATVSGSSVTSTMPTITVVPGAVSLTQSLITLSSSTVASGSTATVTLQAKDAAGNSLNTGGLTVLFSRSGGVSNGSFSAVVDNSNGTYVATFTATTAGTATTIGSTIGGSAVTSSLPTLTVTPGTLSLAQSVLSASPSTILSGASSTLTLTAKDAAGNALTSGGSTVVFSALGGSSAGTISGTVDNANGTYTASFTGTTAGSATSINATVGGSSVTSTSPTITVNPGSISLAQSLVTVSSATVLSGSAVTVTLQAKDAAGNNLTAGGSTITFSRSGGTSSGTFGAVTDNLNGTYTATFTGTASGSATTINGKIAGNAVTTTLPTVTVSPGAVSLAQSLITTSSSSVASGATATVTLTARDANGNALTAGGLVVTFARSGGVSNGTFSAVADNNNGTYSATFTGTTSGSATTLAATIGGSSVTSTAPTITVTPGSISLSQSLVSVSASTMLSGANTTLTLTAKDAAGNQLTSGGLTVAFGRSGGVSSGTIGSVTDNSNGTYTAIFTGTTSGSATTISATVGGANITSTLPTITVTPGATSLSQSLITVSAPTVASGNTSTLTLTTKDASGNNITTGGGTVLFGRSGGVSSGTFSAVTDNGNGTYTATFTATTSGTATSITATIGGANVTSSLPSELVVPGTADPTQSTITVSAATISAGNASVVTLRAKDAAGNSLTSGGSTITFSRSGGSSTGTFSSVANNGDGTYSSTFTGVSSGTATTIGGTLNGATVSSTLPTITVVPGSSTVANSIVTVSSATVLSGATVTLTLQAKDSSGNNLTSGGLTVVFSRSGGGSSGTISGTTDNGNGTYAATFLATASGTATTINATIGGTNVTSTLPTVTVSPGAVSLAQSTLGVSAASIVSGATSTLTLQARDAFGNNLTGGGLTVTAAKSGGVSSGTIATFTDNNNGTYTSTFTGTTSGTATSIVASIGGSSVTSTAPTITVTPGAATVGQSVVSVSVGTVSSGGTVTVTLTSKDANGNSLTTGGLAVAFARSGGVSSGTFTGAIDNNNGTYTSTFTATVSGTATTVTATINGTPVTTTLPTITVNPGAYSLSQSVVSVSAASIASGATSVLKLTLKDANGNALTSGGLTTVVFSRSGGGSSGTISSTTDNGNGTYSANFVGTTAGTATTITASVAGANVTSTQPTVTVTPGTVSLAQSLVSITGSPSTVTSGSAVTVVLTTYDSAGNALTAGGLTVAFAVSGGTSTGSFSTVVDNNNGTYQATFTGAAAGTAISMGAKIAGSSVTSTAPTLTVVPGPYSLANSNITLSATSVLSGSTVTATLKVLDAYGNQQKTGGLAPTFFSSGGSSTVTISSVTDNANGTYVVTLTGVVSGTPTSIGASISGANITSTLPTVIVNPGSFSLSRSVLTVSATSVASGSTVTLTLTTKDAAGNALTTGSQAVVFSRSGGTSTGNISGTTDNNNGTYAANMVGVVSGTATTINATINGTSITSTLPTVTVIPGAVSLAKSTLSLSATTVASGSAITLTLQAEDAAGNNLTAGGLTIGLTQGSGGTSVGTFGVIADNSNGTYTTTFTGTTSGTARLFAATIGGSAVTSTMPSVTVTPGSVSLANSVVTASGTQVVAGASVTLTLQAKDTAGNTITSGGLSVGFGYSGGTSTGSSGATSDNNNGTYTAAFTGQTSGTATTITATIGGAAVTSTPMPQVTVLPLPVLNTIAAQTNATTPLTVGTAYSFDLYNTVTGNDSGMTYSCYYDRNINGTVATTNLCTSMPGSPTFSTTTGQFSWTPPATGAGPYELMLQGCTTAGCNTEYLSLNVKQTYTTTGLIADMDAQFASSLITEGVNSPLTSTWKNLVVTNPVQDSTLTSDMQSGNPWTGDGTQNGSGTNTSQGPFRISLNGSSNYVDLSTTTSSFPSDLVISTWIRPSLTAASATNTVGTTIFSNGGGTTAGTAGIELLQSTAVNGALELAVGGAQSWETVNQAVAPLMRFRLNETTLTNGAAIADSSGNGNNATVHTSNATWTSVAGGPPGTSDTGLQSLPTSATGNYIITNSTFSMTGFQVFTYEMWFKTSSASYTKGGYLMEAGNNGAADNGDGNHDRKLWIDNTGLIHFGVYNGSSVQSIATTTAYNDGNWHYVAASYNYAASGGTLILNVDQAAAVTATGVGTAQTSYSAYIKIGSATAWTGYTYTNFSGSIDEVSVYSSILTPAQIQARAKARGCRSTTTLANNTFYNVGVAYVNSTKTATMYINGVSQCAQTYAGVSAVSSLPFTFGARPLAGSTYSNFWAGGMANIRLYNSSGTSISTIYSATSGLFP